MNVFACHLSSQPSSQPTAQPIVPNCCKLACGLSVVSLVVAVVGIVSLSRSPASQVTRATISVANSGCGKQTTTMVASATTVTQIATIDRFACSPFVRARESRFGCTNVRATRIRTQESSVRANEERRKVSGQRSPK